MVSFEYPVFLINFGHTREEILRYNFRISHLPATIIDTTVPLRLNALVFFHPMEKTGWSDFTALYHTYARDMYWVAMAMCSDSFLAEEAVQDTFVKIWERKYDLKAVQNPHAYLATLVRNYLRDYYKHLNVEKAHESSVGYDITTQNLEDLTQEEKDELINQAKELVNSLPEGCRRIFIKAVIERMKYSEIADSENISINTVKTQLRIARQKLKNSDPILIAILLQLIKF